MVNAMENQDEITKAKDSLEANEQTKVDKTDAPGLNTNNVGSSVTTTSNENRNDGKREDKDGNVQRPATSEMFRVIKFQEPGKIALYKSPIVMFGYDFGEVQGEKVHMTIMFSTVGDPEKEAMIKLWNTIYARYPEIEITILDRAPFENKQHPEKVPYLCKTPILRKHLTMLSKFNRYELIPHLSSSKEVKGMKLKGKLFCHLLYTTNKFKPGDLVSRYIGNVDEESKSKPSTKTEKSEKADSVK